jgi:hypothetical protein
LSGAARTAEHRRLVPPAPSAASVGELALGHRGGALERRAFDVHVRQRAVQPTGQVPGDATRQGHDRRDERHPDDEGVDEHAEGEGEPDAPDGGVRAEDESPNTDAMIKAAAVTTRAP